MSIPEVFFRETIDINRYSNAVSVDLVRTYNDVILLAARKLNAINIRQAKAGEGVVIAPQTKKRLRAIIAQSKSSLDKWSKTSAKKMIKEIEGLAKVQAGFIENELKKAVKSGNIPINSVAISPKYAESFVTTDPTKVNIFTSKQFTEDDFKKFGSGKFELTARQGAMQTLPNGETVEKAFRGIATRQQEGLARTIRQGVFSGESTQQIASRMIGRLEFGQRGSVRQIAQAGGEMTKLANHQIQTIVRTSVNQVQNQASQAVYAANSKVAPKYEYVATLDSRTSPICKRLDGRKFEYNKGPTPPQHFNCRSTTVPVVDYAGLKKQKGFEDLTPPPKGKVVTRPTGEGTGRVPQDTQYGDWLLGQDKKLKVKTLGNEQKVRYFERLAKKEGSGQKAIRKMVREDGSERSLKDLQRLYGKPSDITIKIPKPKPVTKPTITITNQDKLEEIAKAARAAERKAKAELKELKQRNPLQPTIAQLQGISAKQKIQPVDVNNAFNLMDEMEGLAGVNARKLRKFTEQREVFCAWTTGAETRGRAYGNAAKKIDEKIAFLKENAQLKRSMELAKKRGQKGVRDSVAPSVDPITRRNQFSNSERTAMGLGKIDEILESGFGSSTSWGHAYFTKFVTTGKTKAFGYTLQGANHIAMKAKPFHKKIKNLASIKSAVKDSIQQAAKGTPLGNVDANLYQWKGRSLASKTGDSWLTTYVHEMGHQVHYAANRPAMAGKAWIPSRYGGGNYMEEFAETFVQYVFDPVELKRVSPDAYKWVDDALAAALEAPL
jgi:SPP1 gp7 family putative phage head morphogenesis protein